MPVSFDFVCRAVAGGPAGQAMAQTGFCGKRPSLKHVKTQFFFVKGTPMYM